MKKIYQLIILSLLVFSCGGNNPVEPSACKESVQLWNINFDIEFGTLSL